VYSNLFMADLEEHAFRRDKRFVVRLVLTLSLATLGGLFVYKNLTRGTGAGCTAGSLLGYESP